MTLPDTVLVLPTYHDSTGLAEFLPKLCAELARGVGGIVVQVVEDGSSRGEQMWITNEIDRLRREFNFLQPLLILTRNQGKGHAIRTGWAAHPAMKWLGFVDADGAVPATEVVSLLGFTRRAAQPALSIAVRTEQPGKIITRFWHRRFGSRIFNRWVRLCLKLNLPDTQCGLKVIPASLSREGAWREDGFAFDLELLLRARAVGLPIVTQPISWREHAGSSLSPGAMLGLFVAAWRLRKTKAGRFS